MTGSCVQVNGDRLWSDLMALAQVGAYDDERTGLRGVNRLSPTRKPMADAW